MCRLGSALSVFLVGLFFTSDLMAQTQPPPVVVPQVTPRLNEPGPQVPIPKPPSPAQQPPSVGAGTQSAPVPYQDVSPAPKTSSDRHTANKEGGYCSYDRCIQRCWDSGIQVIRVRSGSSCPDTCKRRGCGNSNRVRTGTWPQGW
jgi:hypothetical protein